MKRLSRHLFTLCSAASLVLFVLAVGLGGWSYRHGRLVEWHSARLESPLRFVERRHMLGMSGGTFAYSIRTDMTDHTDPLLASDALDDWGDRTPERLNVLVFIPQPLTLAGYRVTDLKVLRYALLDRPTGREHAVLVPFWALAPLLAVLPACWLVRHRRRALLRRRAAAGQCLACGYDLRATPEGARCPECGTPAA